ncbi:occlusion derived viral protein-e56 [Ectropis obliqua nucleopolyhedrovirus]|uniref:Occlusion derived viral protein-e56 n=1 Tax=Ectropis obliqua nucleopolyhedrovirus TaxID=59376 RepID=A0EYQ8_9ABAC|nr:occlusion derived viral protein-e56 [Ectropis obliqua nucleopolyhedrovirus]ABI35689.1 occlusion derived viral protein-e56 [Ectropis obliqua nucleopolyhedrovirus]AGS47872.1 occlusion-derived virus envelope protein E56 [Ectropis obliqua nucleopolyhedrovirus]QWV59591.1 occlusion derived viral protein-e56 [Ectropis obliqua nucleopolyhedrovirus]UYO72797.1 occlusion derived viral protein-e56 [Ectropis obliqua nucleopolyhedrovirus]
MSFFTSLRRVNKVYPNPNQFTNVDNFSVLQSAPSGFSFNNPSTVFIGNNRYVPGYNIGNNQFVPVSDINRVMRNNDVTGIRNIFTSANNNQINSLNQIRRIDNIPDANLHSSAMRRNAVKQNYPNTVTRTPDGIQNVLNQNPSLNTYLTNLKTAGVAVLLGAGVYLIFTSATLIQDIIAALNRVGGSYFIQGRNGGDESDTCLLVDRTCRLENPSNENVNFCLFDPILNNNVEALRAICNNYDYETEQTVCRASDPYAHPDSLQYVDISDLGTGQTITCIEPYDMGDLIGDLGLDHLLGAEGLLSNSSDKSKSASDILLPIILVLGGLILLVVVAFFIIKRYMNSNSVTVSATNAASPNNVRT